MGENRDGALRQHVPDEVIQLALLSFVKPAVDHFPEHNTLHFPELAGGFQLPQHAVDPVSRFVDIFDQQNAVAGLNFIGCFQGTAQQGQAPADEPAAGGPLLKHMSLGSGQ